MVQDKWGLSWQITRARSHAAFTDPDRAAAKRVFEAMMTMRKIDIATIEAARKAEPTLRHSPPVGLGAGA
jgi:2-polyprenyl-6-hydroxyphenyl methylase/3-demethylubiquinone-9 3-methyltransferase